MKKRKSRYNKSRRSRNSGNTAKMLALAAIPLVLAAGGTALLMTSGEEKIDEKFCYQRSDQHRHAVFIDSSMVLDHSDSQLRDYRTALENAYENAPANSRIMIFTTSADTSGSLAKPVYEQCKPASTPAEQMALGAPSKPAPYLAKQQTKAKSLYDQSIDQILLDVQDSTKSAGSSPILEQIRSISHYAGFQNGSRHLTVITDGVQNSTLAKFCRIKGNMPSFSNFTKRSDYKISIKPREFANMNVSLLMMETMSLPNFALPYCSNNELKQWWYDYFIGNGANSVELTPLQYLSGAL